MPNAPRTFSKKLKPKRFVYERRGSANERGYTYRWQQARLNYLKQNPLCVNCLKHGVTTAATDVDHIIPHRGDMSLFWDPNNWQSLCSKCHKIKTGKGE